MRVPAPALASPFTGLGAGGDHLKMDRAGPRTNPLGISAHKKPAFP